MRVTPTEFPEVLLIEPEVHDDRRGFFLEVYQAERYREAGLRVDFVQDNLSRSRRGVVRGLHFQLSQPQGKLVSVVRGAIYDVVVDVRRGGPRFGRWIARELSDTNHRQLYVPPGFAHGFCVLSPMADVFYKCTSPYLPGDEVGFNAFSPELGIPWPAGRPILSARDAALPSFSLIPPDRLPLFR